MTVIKTNDLQIVIDGLKSQVDKVAQAILEALAERAFSTVVADYNKRLQLLHYPLRNPKTKEVLDSMPPSQIAKFVKKVIMQDTAYVYLPPGTEADKAGRMQELYGGKPWQMIRMKMQEFDYINAALAEAGLKGIKAKTIV